jgi:hypothetical protein
MFDATKSSQISDDDNVETGKMAEELKTTSQQEDNEPSRPNRSKGKRYVSELRADEVRWFYKLDSSDAKWRSFNGLKSLSMSIMMSQVPTHYYWKYDGVRKMQLLSKKQQLMI